MSNPQPPRFNLYTSIHKGLRAFMADTLLAVGSTDGGDSEQVDETRQQLVSLLQFCRGHLNHEDHFIHPALEAVKTNSSQHCGEDHVEHLHSIHRLELALEHAYTLSNLKSSDAASTWLELYLQLSQFVAENFEHMYREEVEHMAVLWAHYSDQELLHIHANLLASVSPEDMAVAFRWMVPHLTHTERSGILKGMQTQMPAEVFALRLEAALELLPVRERHKLAATFNQTIGEVA